MTDGEQTPEEIAAAEATAEATRVADEAKAAEDAKAKEDGTFVDDGASPEGEVKTAEAKKEDEEDEELDPEDKDAIGKAVKKAIAPLEDTIHSNKVETELNNIFTQNPEYKPYEARIRRFVTAPNRSIMIKQGLPVKTVVIEALAPVLEQLGATKRKAADDKANQARVDGGSERPAAGGKLPDFSKMTPDEIREVGEQVKSGRYNPTK